jgi:hypothetical protein
MFFVFDKNMTIVYNFNPDDSLRFSNPYPWYRLLPVEHVGSDYSQKVKAELIYFSVRIPPNFNDANLCVKYSGQPSSIRLGAEKAFDKYEFVDTKVTDIDSQWKKACANFNLREFLLSNYYIKNNKLTFAISAAGVTDQNLLTLTEIDLNLKKNYSKNEMQNFYARLKQALIRR